MSKVPGGLRRDRLRYPLLALGFVFICATSLFCWVAFARLEQANARADQAQRVIVAVDEVRAAFLNLTALQRAYLLAPELHTRTLYNAARDRLDDGVQSLRRTTEHLPGYRERVDAVAALVTGAVHQLDAGLAPGVVQREAVLGMRPALDQLRTALREISQAESALHVARSRQSDTAAMRARMLLLGGTLSSIALIAIVFMMMRRDSQRRSAVEAELRDLNTRLTADVEARTSALTEANAALRAEIASRRLVDEDLVRTRAFLKLVIEHVPGILFIKDAKEHRFILVNRGAEEVFGWDRSELIGKTDHDIFPPEQADRFLARDKRVLASGLSEIVGNERITTRTNATRHLRTKTVPVIDESGRPQFILGFSEDVTTTRQVEQQLRQAQKMEAIGQLTGGVAHDFNNLLLVILGNLELLEVALESQPSLLRLVQTAIRGADRGAALVKSLLAFARKQPLDPVRIEPEKLLRETADMLSRTLGENIKVEVKPGPDPWPCEVDPGQLQSVLLNLAINARDAMPSGGTLRIETANARLSLSDLPDDAGAGPGDYIMFAVTDTGTGMPPEVLERVFDPFFTTKEPGKGSGLGLSMVYGVVRQSRGHVRIESEVGRGTTVRLYLPRVNDARDSAPGPIVEFAPRQPGETILVVEDNADVRTLAATMLASLGYRVLQADTAAAGLAILDTVEPDVLLTDVMLPELSGRELAERALRAQPGLKVVYMSGYTADEAIRNGHAGAAAPLLNKPFRKHELSAAIRAALDATPQQPTRTIGRAATG